MIVSNAIMRVRTNEGWGKPIKCNLQSSSKATISITKNMNRYETEKYEVIIEKVELDTSIVSLEENGKKLGVYRVVGKPSLLQVVQNIQLYVIKIGEWHEQL